MSDIRECPFCGSKEVTIGNEAVGHWLGHYIHCKKCPGNVYGHKTEQGAAEAWNRRAE